MRRLRSRLVGYLSSLVLALTFVAAWTAAPASAATGCAGYNVTFAGWWGNYTYLNTDYGSQAHITTRSTHFCTGTGSGTNTTASEWAMLGASTGGEYVQAGYYQDRTTGGIPYYFAESNVNGVDNQWIDYDDPPPTLGSDHLYTVQYQASPNQEILGFDYTELINVVIPFGTGNWTYRQHLYLGEIHDNGSDIPGTSTSQVEYSYLAIQEPYHTCCQVVSQPLVIKHDLSKFHVSALAYGGFFSYD